MPRYDYQCRKCDRTFEVFATFKEKQAGLQPKCPSCESQETKQLVTVPLFLRVGGDDESALGSGACGPNAGIGCCG